MKVLISGLLLITGLLSQSVQANGLFDEKFLKGTWALFVRGYVLHGVSMLPGTDTVAVATVTFDGRGGCESKDQLVAGGVFVPSRSGFRDTREGGDCRYSVNPDGTGFFDVTFPGAAATNVTFVIVDRARIKFTANNQELGIFGGGEMERQVGRRGNDH